MTTGVATVVIGRRRLREPLGRLSRRGGQRGLSKEGTLGPNLQEAQGAHVKRVCAPETARAKVLHPGKEAARLEQSGPGQADRGGSPEKGTLPSFQVPADSRRTANTRKWAP